jgi:hypothetical protein
VVTDASSVRLGEPDDPMIYQHVHTGNATSAALLLQFTGDARPLTLAVRAAVRALEPQLSVVPETLAATMAREADRYAAVVTVAGIRLLGSSTAVVAVEHAWLARLRSARLYCYQLPPDTFESRDSCAGYFVSRAPVVPLDVRVIDDCLSELIRRGVEVRVMSNLWHLRDAVVSSTLQFSIIRMRSALPRTAAPMLTQKSPENLF